MKEKSFRIEIKNPCHQDWNALPKAQNGLYCGQCAKVVTDFTQLSDAEIIRLLSKSRTEEICGRFHRSQLEKTYQLESTQVSAPYSAFRFLLTGFLALPLFAGAQSSSLQKPPLVKTEQKKAGLKTQAHARRIKGKVIVRGTYTGIAASIKLYADRSDRELISTVLSDSSGHYELLLPGSGLSRFFKITYTSENYEERSVVVDRDKAPRYLPVSLVPLLQVEVTTSRIESAESQNVVPVKLREDYYHTGGIPVSHYTIYKTPFHKRAWYRVKNFFRKTFRKSY